MSALCLSNTYRLRTLDEIVVRHPTATTVSLHDASDPSAQLEAMRGLPAERQPIDVLRVEGWLRRAGASALQALNYRCESCAAAVRRALIIWLDPLTVATLAPEAPELWAWRAVVRDFSHPPPPRAAVHQQPIFIGSAERGERERCLAAIAAHLQTVADAAGDDAGLQRIRDGLAEAFAVNRQLARPEGIGWVGQLLASVLATSGKREQALQLLDLADEAFVKLDAATGLAPARELRAAIRCGLSPRRWGPSLLFVRCCARAPDAGFSVLMCQRRSPLSDRTAPSVISADQDRPIAARRSAAPDRGARVRSSAIRYPRPVEQYLVRGAPRSGDFLTAPMFRRTRDSYNHPNRRRCSSSGPLPNLKGHSMRLRLFALAVAALIPVLAAAQPKSTAEDDEDLKFEESIRNFGFVSGAAYQCLPEADRNAHDREVLKAYSGLVRLFGSDRAFFYAAAFGAGTSMTIDKAKCAAYIEDFRAAMKSGSRGQ